MHAITHTQKSLNLRFKIGKNFLRQIHPCASLCLFCVCLRREVCGSAVVDARTAQEPHTNRNTTSTKKSGFLIFILLPPCMCLRRVGWVSCGNSKRHKNKQEYQNTHKHTQEYQWMLLVLIGILLFASSSLWRFHRVKAQRVQNAGSISWKANVPLSRVHKNICAKYKF